MNNANRISKVSHVGAHLRAFDTKAGGKEKERRRAPLRFLRYFLFVHEAEDATDDGKEVATKDAKDQNGDVGTLGLDLPRAEAEDDVDEDRDQEDEQDDAGDDASSRSLASGHAAFGRSSRADAGHRDNADDADDNGRDDAEDTRDQQEDVRDLFHMLFSFPYDIKRRV